MDDTRLAKSILVWDKTFYNIHKLTTWSSEVKSIFQQFNMQYFSENLDLFPLKETIKSLKNQMKIKQCTDLKLKNGKPCQSLDCI